MAAMGSMRLCPLALSRDAFLSHAHPHTHTPTHPHTHAHAHTHTHMLYTSETCARMRHNAHTHYACEHMRKAVHM